MAVETQSVDILDCYSVLEDPRQRTKVIYPLPEILLLVLCGVMAGADDFSEITRWGKLHVEFLRRFLPYREGIPSHDTVNSVIAALDGEAFRDAFVSWVAGLRAANQDGEVIAIDGKTSRRSGSPAAGIEPLHLVSAWASDQRLVLGHEALRGRDNEIVAIDRLLQWLEITGALVTIDAPITGLAAVSARSPKPSSTTAPITFSPSRPTNPPCSTTRRCGSTMASRPASPRPVSISTRPSMPTTAASRPAGTGSLMTSIGSSSATTGPASPPSP